MCLFPSWYTTFRIINCYNNDSQLAYKEVPSSVFTCRKYLAWVILSDTMSKQSLVSLENFEILETFQSSMLLASKIYYPIYDDAFKRLANDRHKADWTIDWRLASVFSLTMIVMLDSLKFSKTVLATRDALNIVVWCEDTLMLTSFTTLFKKLSEKRDLYWFSQSIFFRTSSEEHFIAFSKTAFPVAPSWIKVLIIFSSKIW